jgi:glycosyltransferase involved in cell wall biosynthesis
MPTKKIAIVLPCFNEDASISKFNDLLLDKIKGLPYQFDLVYVNDGSTDQSADIISRFKTDSPNINIILLNLFFNMGHQAAIFQGLLFTEKNGYDNVLIMDSDGEDDPAAIETILRFSEVDLVQVVRGKRNESLTFRICYKIYRALFYLVVGKGIHFGNFSLIKPKLVKAATEKSFDNLAAFLDNQRCTKTQVVWDRQKRLGGNSKMKLKGLFYHAVFSLTENAQSMLFQFIRLSLVIFLGIFIFSGIIVYNKYFSHAAILGWSSTLLTTLFNTLIISVGVFILGVLQLNILNKKARGQNNPLFEQKNISTNWKNEITG